MRRVIALIPFTALVLLAAVLAATPAGATSPDGVVTSIPFQDRAVMYAPNGSVACVASGDQTVAYGYGFLSTGITVWVHRCFTYETITPQYVYLSWTVQFMDAWGNWTNLPGCGVVGQQGLINGFTHIDRPHCVWAVVGNGVPIRTSFNVQAGWNLPGNSTYTSVVSPVGYL